METNQLHFNDEDSDNINEGIEESQNYYSPTAEELKLEGEPLVDGDLDKLLSYITNLETPTADEIEPLKVQVPLNENSVVNFSL